MFFFSSLYKITWSILIVFHVVSFFSYFFLRFKLKKERKKNGMKKTFKNTLKMHVNVFFFVTVWNNHVVIGTSLHTINYGVIWIVCIDWPFEKMFEFLQRSLNVSIMLFFFFVSFGLALHWFHPRFEISTTFFSLQWIIMYHDKSIIKSAVIWRACNFSFSVFIFFFFSNIEFMHTSSCNCRKSWKIPLNVA